MAKFCQNCGRPKGQPHHLFGICDQVKLSDGRTVHADRVRIGGDLHDELDRDGLKVVSRNITPEMRVQHEKALGKKDAA